ncbi:MAG: hypothetical protein PHH47_07045 [Gallionella sp.]|nr:hypothetical protein [Gallionella sp.]MDD4946684.1 hypothetical protein [Gallionella sp.]
MNPNLNLNRDATLLTYRNARYLKATAAAALLAVTVYLAGGEAGSPGYGGTVAGYGLGIAATLLLLVLMFYGVARRGFGWRRKAGRVARGEGATLQGWLSAHVYLGGLLLVLATLHSGFEFGWNVHTLPYALMVLVMASGGYGLYAYLTLPARLTANLGGETLADLLLKVAELDRSAEARALQLPDEVNALVRAACRETRVGGDLWQQLSGVQRDCPTHAALQRLPELAGKCREPAEQAALRDLYEALSRKEGMLLRARADIMLRARMTVWLRLHAPLGIALLAALVAHVFTVYYFW